MADFTSKQTLGEVADDVIHIVSTKVESVKEGYCPRIDWN